MPSVKISCIVRCQVLIPEMQTLYYIKYVHYLHRIKLLCSILYMALYLTEVI